MSLKKRKKVVVMPLSRIEKNQPQHVTPYCPPSGKAVAATLSIITGIVGVTLVGIALFTSEEPVRLWLWLPEAVS